MNCRSALLFVTSGSLYKQNLARKVEQCRGMIGFVLDSISCHEYAEVSNCVVQCEV